MKCVNATGTYCVENNRLVPELLVALLKPLEDGFRHVHIIRIGLQIGIRICTNSFQVSQH